jgi:hypothetical protein
VLESSNSGSKVNFAAGSKEVFCTYPAERSVYLDAAGSAVSVLDIGTLGVTTANITTANITAGTVSTTPASGNDLVNKTYVDTLVASGIHFHQPVRVESPINLNATYNNGTAGVGATLTNAGTQVALVIDGITMVVADRVLVYEQTNETQNGIYVVTSAGSGSTNWVLTRASDADTYVINSADGLSEGSSVFVQQGTTGAGETYTCNTSGTITFGTTNITFAQISSAQIYSAGTGLTLSGTQFSITNTGTAGTYGSASSVPVFSTNAQGQITSATPTAIAIAAAAVSGLAASATTDTTNAANITSGTLPSARLNGSYTGITGVGTLAAGTWNGSTIAAIYGGTGLTSFAQGDLLYATSSTTVGRLADAVAGNALLSGGVGGDPAWGKIGFGTHVSGTLPLGNGGTGATTLTGYVFGNGTGAFSASTSIPNAATTATNLNTASAIVARDGSGNFSAGTITASLNGNASTATTAANVNNGTLTLAVSGTGLSGSATFTANQSGNSTFTVASNATNLNTVSTIVARDGSGNFSAGTVTAALSGNATTATTLQTARNIGGVSFNGSADINLPGVNTAGNQNTSGTAANVSGTVAVANGGTGATTAAAARTNLGATTLGGNLFTLTNVAATAFPRFNADNTVSSLDAAAFRTAIGAGTSSTTGTVTSVGGTGTVSGLTLTGTVTTSGNLTLGGTLAVLPSNFASQTANTFLAAPNGSAGTPTFRAVVAADIPTLNQNTTGTAAISTAATVTTSATASAFKVPFANTTASTTGNYGLLQDSEGTFTYNPSTNTLTVGTVSGALSGNATTATTLQTARTIGGVSFNGSANIDLPGVNTAGNQNTTGSAATLTTTRTLWGQNFNGSANVTGALTSVGNITGTGAVTLTATSGTLGLTATGANIITATTNAVERMRIDSSGNVGIGTSTTNNGTLNINGVPGKIAYYNANNYNAEAGLGVLTGFGDTFGINARQSGGILAFGTNNTERMRISSAGDVGIGTQAPTALLHVAGAARLGNSDYELGSIELNRHGTGDRAAFIDLHSSGTPLSLDFSARVIRSPGVNGNLEFVNTGTGSIVLNPGGGHPALFVTAGVGMQYNGTLKLGGGGGAPLGQLDFNADADVRWLARLGRLDCVNTANNAWQQGTFRAAKLEFRTQDDVVRFTVNPDTRCFFNNNSASRGASGHPLTTPNDTVANIFRNAGYLEMNTDVGNIGISYFLSDARLKKNIAPTAKTARQAIDQIEFKQFDWNEFTDKNNEHVELGVIAQQLQQVHPKFVNEMSDSTLGVNEPELLTYALKAIQELSAELAAVKQELAQLKGAA